MFIAEKPFRLAVGSHDEACLIRHEDGVRRKLEQLFEKSSEGSAVRGEGRFFAHVAATSGLDAIGKKATTRIAAREMCKRERFRIDIRVVADRVSISH